ncbi:MAG: SCP2 sterol-binding domain-containing protein [Methylophilaceae bacterium]
MLKPFITHFLQHLIQQNSWAKPHLMAFAGRTIQFDFAIFKTNLIILEDGSLAIGGETTPPEASVYAPPSLMLRMLARDEAAKMQFKITGDTHLATEISKILQNMRWDIEGDLSQLVGDIPATKMVDVGKKAVKSIKKTSTNLAGMLTEYLQEEQPMIAKKRHLDQFNTDVDTLRNDVERFEKRMAKLVKESLTKEKFVKEMNI